MSLFSHWFRPPAPPDYKQALAGARAWIEANSTGDGVCVSRLRRDTYREVTGYFVPSLIAIGDHARARAWAEAMRACQQPDGSITAVDGTPYIFDTAQVMRGFLCYAGEQRFRDALVRGAEYLTSVLRPDGSFPDPYGGKIPTYIFLYCIDPWRRAGELAGRPDLVAAANRCLEHYAGAFNPEDFSAHSHFFGYAAEALIDCGKPDLARRTIATALRELRRDGALRAAQGVKWVCGPGQAQFAICCYKLNDLATGDRLLHWLIRHQQPNGGFLGCYGKGSHYFPDDEPSWGVKFFLDALRWRIRRHFELEFPTWMDAKERENDFRLRAVQGVLAALPAGARVLEIGCGNGRFLSQLRRALPGLEYHGLDLSATLVAALPEWMHGRQGDMQSLPYGAAEFDAAFMIESLEHAPDWRAALAEAARVVKPGGRLAVIDKNAECLGQLKLMPWESWFRVDEVRGELQRHCPDAASEFLDQQREGAPPNLFALWKGVRG